MGLEVNDMYFGWQYLKDLNELNEVLEMTEEERSNMGLDGITGMDDLVSVTYDTNHGCYVAIWKCRNKSEKKNLSATWISVSERMPEEAGTYMTTVDYGKNGLATGQRYYHGKGLGWEDDCVTAWMPLPSPFK